MKPFTRLDGIVVPLDRANVDTDQIIPKQFLKSIRRTGFGDNLFDAWRYLDEGAIGTTPNERRLNREFVLNQPQYQGASILLARDNFGCGSSREHAVWALEEYGLRCVVAPSFADIFYNNCFKNGVLPIALDKIHIDDLFRRAAAQEGLRLAIDLTEQTITLPDGSRIGFDIEPGRKRCLLQGLDEIGVTLQQSEQIAAFEDGHRSRFPWLFRKP
jgi:3-isopropylmalate/(R)-2-methylmalate dehydratase small subunit